MLEIEYESYLLGEMKCVWIFLFIYFLIILSNPPLYSNNSDNNKIQNNTQNSTQDKKSNLSSSFWNPIGLSFLSPNYSLNENGQSKLLQINLVSGEVHNLYGLHFGFISNKAKRGSRQFGVSIAGLISANEKLSGICLSLIGCGTTKEMNGISMTGFVSVNEKLSGICLSLIGCGTVKEMNGISIAGIAQSSQQANGFIISGITSQARKSQGLLVSGIISGVSKNVKGIVVSSLANLVGENYGTEIAMVNYAGNNHFVQTGLINISQVSKGVQFGLFNYTSEKSKLQIGLLNFSLENKIPFLPFINF